MTVFFCDRDLGKSFPKRLREAGIAVERHDDHFDQKTEDEDWLAAVGSRGWYGITHNERIRYTPVQRDAAMKAGVGLFILIGAASTRDLANNFVKTIDSIRRFISETPVPFIAKVYRPSPAEAEQWPGTGGRVELWLTESEWQLMIRQGR